MKHLLIIVLGIFYVSFQAQNSTDVDFNLVNQSLITMSPDFEGGSARYASMSGAMGGLGGNVSAVNLNPAGIGVFIQSDLSFTLAYNGYKDKSILGNERQKNSGNFGFNQVGGVISMNSTKSNWKTVNLSILYDRQSLTHNLQFAKDDSLHAYDFDANQNIVNTYNFEGYERDIEGKKEKISFGLGTNFKNKLFLGANLNIHMYRMEYDYLYLAYSPAESNTFGYTPWNYPYKEEGAGISLSMGALYRPIKEIRLGAAYQTPIGWGDISTSYDEHTYDSTSGLVNSEVGIGLWEEDTASSSGFATLSAGLVLMQKWALNFDFISQFTNNNKFKPNSEYTGTNNFLGNFVNNRKEFRIGTEYIYNDFSVRAGTSWSPSPMDDVTLSSDYINSKGETSVAPINDLFLAKTQSWAMGFGYQFNKVILDFAYQQSKQTYNTIIHGTHVDPGFYPLYVPNMVGEVKNNTQRFIVTATVRF